MNEDWLSRTSLLLGEEKLSILKSKHVLVIGLGGVGAFAAEMIARAGVGTMTIADGDTINKSNINRQLPAVTSSIGISKANWMENRLKDINPELKLTAINEYLKDERIVEILDNHYDYVVDAIDTFSPKVFTIFNCLKNGLKLVSSMGSGGKVDPAQVKIAKMKDSYNCKLAFKVRKRLSQLKADKNFPVVYSSEQVDQKLVQLVEGEPNKKSMVGTISYMPAVFGMFCASVVIRDLVGDFKL